MNSLIRQESGLPKNNDIAYQPGLGNYFILPLYFTLLYWLLAPVSHFVASAPPAIYLGDIFLSPLPRPLYTHLFYGTVLFCTAGIACSTLNRGRPFRFTPSLLLPATQLFLIFYLCHILYSLLHVELLISTANYINWNAPHPVYAMFSYCMLNVLKMFIFMILFITLFQAHKRRFNHSIQKRLPVRGTQSQNYIHQLHALLFALCMNLWMLLFIKMIYQVPLLFIIPSDQSVLPMLGTISLFLSANLLSIAVTWFFTHTQFPTDVLKLSCKKVLLSAVTCIGLQMLMCLILATVLLIMMPASWSFYQVPNFRHIGLPEISIYWLCAVTCYFFLSRFSIRYHFGQAEQG